MSAVEPSKRQRLVTGSLLVLVAAGVSLVIHLHPENLRAPAWVAYAAAGSFGLAGAALIAGAYGAVKAVQWLGVLTVAALLTPALWVSVGPGGRGCTVSFGFLSGAAAEWACRGGFGLGAVLGLVILVLMLRQALGRP